MSEGVNICQDKRLMQFNDDRSVGVQRYSACVYRNKLLAVVTAGTSLTICAKERTS
jgi:pantothenate kinase type III